MLSLFLRGGPISVKHDAFLQEVLLFPIKNVTPLVYMISRLFSIFIIIFD